MASIAQHMQTDLRWPFEVKGFVFKDDPNHPFPNLGMDVIRGVRQDGEEVYVTLSVHQGNGQDRRRSVRTLATSENPAGRVSPGGVLLTATRPYEDKRYPGLFFSHFLDVLQAYPGDKKRMFVRGQMRASPAIIRNKVVAGQEIREPSASVSYIDNEAGFRALSKQDALGQIEHMVRNPSQLQALNNRLVVYVRNLSEDEEYAVPISLKKVNESPTGAGDAYRSKTEDELVADWKSSDLFSAIQQMGEDEDIDWEIIPGTIFRCISSFVKDQYSKVQPFYDPAAKVSGFVADGYAKNAQWRDTIAVLSMHQFENGDMTAAVNSLRLMRNNDHSKNGRVFSSEKLSELYSQKEHAAETGESVKEWADTSSIKKMSDVAPASEVEVDAEAGLVTICEFGTAPDQKKDGFGLTGLTLRGTEEEMLKLFEHSTDAVRLVRGAGLEDSDTRFEWYPMTQTDATPVQRVDDATHEDNAVAEEAPENKGPVVDTVDQEPSSATADEDLGGESAENVITDKDISEHLTPDLIKAFVDFSIDSLKNFQVCPVEFEYSDNSEPSTKIFRDDACYSLASYTGVDRLAALDDLSAGDLLDVSACGDHLKSAAAGFKAKASENDFDLLDYLQKYGTDFLEIFGDEVVTAFPGNSVQSSFDAAFQWFASNLKSPSLVAVDQKTVEPKGEAVESKEELDLSDLPSGVYTIRLHLETGKAEMIQIVKQ